MKIQKILVVEDDMIIQMFISKVLSDAGFDVIGEVRTSAEVLDFVEKHDTDLILMDIGIAGPVDGIETANIVRKKFNTPIIFITGNSDQSTIERAKQSSPIDFIFKPIDEQRLKRRLIELNRED